MTLLVCALSEVNRKQETGSGPGEGLTADKWSVRGSTPNKEREGDLHGLYAGQKPSGMTDQEEILRDAACYIANCRNKKITVRPGKVA